MIDYTALKKCADSMELTPGRLQLIMELIPEELKEIIEASWGIDGSQESISYKDLAWKMGKNIEEAKVLYHEAVDAVYETNRKLIKESQEKAKKAKKGF